MDRTGWGADVSLAAVGAGCAILTTLSFVVGVILLGSSGGEDLIPSTGQEGVDWIVAVDDASDGFVGGAWLIVLTTVVGLVALVGFYDEFKVASPLLILAPILGSVGLSMVTISHLIPIALAYEFVPVFVAADEAAQVSLSATFDTLASLSQVLNYVGNFLGWGVAVPLYAVAILRTRLVPHWIGWLGFAVAALAGWLALLAPASDAIEGISFIGFIGFFVFMLSLGIAMLLRRRQVTSSVR